MATRTPIHLPRMSFLQFVRMAAENPIGARDVRDELIVKATVNPGTTEDVTWAGPLADLTGSRDFRGFLEKTSVPMRAGTQIPGSVPVPRQTSPASGYWVAQAANKPLGALTFEGVNLPPRKVTGLTVVSNELLRFSNPRIDTLLSAQLRRAIVRVSNTSFLDPANTGVALEEPASVTNGATSVPATGNIVTDIAALIQLAIDADVELGEAVIVLSAASAVQLAANVPTSTTIDVRARSGTYLGIPLVLAHEATEDIVLIDASRVYVAAGGIDVSRADQVTLQMRSDPQSGPQNLVSLWQTDSVALRVEQILNWSAATDSVFYVDGSAS